MPLHAVLYRYSTDAGDTTALDAHRPAHKEYLASLYEQGRIVVSGPLADGAPGALLVLDAADSGEVAEWLDGDPFWTLDLIADRQIRRWTPAFGAHRLGG